MSVLETGKAPRPQAMFGFEGPKMGKDFSQRESRVPALEVTSRMYWKLEEMVLFTMRREKT